MNRRRRFLLPEDFPVHETAPGVWSIPAYELLEYLSERALAAASVQEFGKFAQAEADGRIFAYRCVARELRRAIELQSVDTP